MSYNYDPDHYYLYDEMVTLLKEMQTAYPDLVQVYSIGKSYENREIYLAEVTDFSTGKGESKPGILLTGNLHGMEVSGSAMVLYSADVLLKGYNTNTKYTQLLKENTFYLIPRINPDGAEYFMTTAHTIEYIRGSTRDYFPARNGIYEKDIDHNGIIVSMRIEDPYGDYKKSKYDERLMVLREAGDMEGPFYRVYQEGLVRGDNYLAPEDVPSTKGLDPNRAFPSNWSHERPSSGPYPLYESEPKAVADFVLAHPNIVLANDSHTAIGAHISAIAFDPSCYSPTEDQEHYIQVTKAASKSSGYIPDFNPGGPNVDIPSTITNWLYYNQGIMAWCTEVWNVFRAADPSLPEHYTAFDSNDDEYERGLAKVVQWTDTLEGGPYYIPWHEFDHPQLGKVEIGGFNLEYVFFNIPPHLLKEECDKVFQFVCTGISCMPKAVIDTIHVTKLDDRMKVEAVICNAGYNPLSGTYLADEKHYSAPSTVTLSGIQPYSEATVTIPNLGSYKRTVARWIIPLVENRELTITVHTSKAGNPSKTFKVA